METLEIYACIHISIIQGANFCASLLLWPMGQCTDDGIGSWKTFCFDILGFIREEAQLSEPLLIPQRYFYLYHYAAVATLVEPFKKRPHISYDNCNALGTKWQS